MYEKELSNAISRGQLDRACQIIYSGEVADVSLINFYNALKLQSPLLIDGLLKFQTIRSSLHLDNFSIVHFAIAQGNVEIVNKLLCFPLVRAKLVDPNNEFLICAIQNNKADVVRFLLTFEAAKLFLDSDNNAILNHARNAQCCFQEIYAALIEVATVRNKKNPKKRSHSPEPENLQLVNNIILPNNDIDEMELENFSTSNDMELEKPTDNDDLYREKKRKRI